MLWVSSVCCEEQFAGGGSLPGFTQYGDSFHDGVFSNENVSADLELSVRDSMSSVAVNGFSLFCHCSGSACHLSQATLVRFGRSKIGMRVLSRIFLHPLPAKGFRVFAWISNTNSRHCSQFKLLCRWWPLIVWSAHSW